MRLACIGLSDLVIGIIVSAPAGWLKRGSSPVEKLGPAWARAQADLGFDSCAPPIA